MSGIFHNFCLRSLLGHQVATAWLIPVCFKLPAKQTSIASIINYYYLRFGVANPDWWLKQTLRVCDICVFDMSTRVFSLRVGQVSIRLGLPVGTLCLEEIARWQVFCPLFCASAVPPKAISSLIGFWYRHSTLPSGYYWNPSITRLRNSWLFHKHDFVCFIDCQTM